MSAKVVQLPPAPARMQNVMLEVGDGSSFELNKKEGLLLLSAPDKNGISKPVWLASPFSVDFAVRDFDNDAWGKVIRWCDADGQEHTLHFPLSLLSTAPGDVLSEMIGNGLPVATARGARDALSIFLQRCPAQQKGRSVKRAGWTQDGRYVMPDGSAIGDGNGEPIFFSKAEKKQNAIDASDELQRWKSSVARLARGNSRLMLAIMASFAAPLLSLAGEGGGGFHFRGASSTGKTTALHVAASIAGSSVKSWRATGNGLEGVSALHNDALLLIDEINQCAPVEVGETAYMLANGVGKARATRAGTARESAQWRLMFLSSGEQDLESILKSVKKKTMAGMEIRMLSVPADAGAGMGMLECLHEHKTPGALAEAIVHAANQCKAGAAQRTWLEFLTCDLFENQSGDAIKKAVDHYSSLLASEQDAGQIRRAARRFAVLWVAGTATTDITEWSKDEVESAIRKCFEDWKDGYTVSGETDGQKESVQITEQAVSFLQMHARARFQPMLPDSQSEASIVARDRAGFSRVVEATGETEYLVFSESFKNEICKGFDYKDACNILSKAGILKHEQGYFTTKVSLPGLGRQRVYILRASGDESADDSITNTNF